mmetsp:Transcript_23571/g.28981  ORF Transcript_23571/g.28981 Transcript_23571/m.28981 type:complete len:97 (-) Transcript_23571:237-527(-)
MFVICSIAGLIHLENSVLQLSALCRISGIFAFLVKIQAMLADCMAMSVDTFTYLFNLDAERLKYYDPPIFGPVDNILKKSYGDGKLNVSIWNSHHH